MIDDDAELDDPSGNPPLPPTASRIFQADTASTGLRLDVWLETLLPECSRTRIRDLILQGNITIQGSPAKPHRKVTAGMRASVQIPPPLPTDITPQAIPLDILHEDDAIIVINKPPGLVVHPAAGHADGTLVNALLHHCPNLTGIGGEQRPGIVHRLDKDTSGVLVVAKSDLAIHALQRQFKDHSILKIYIALVRGRPRTPKATIDLPIQRSPHDRKKMGIAPPQAGRNAITHYEVIETFTNAACLRIRLETGRTHQIRLHLAHIGHPVLGDQLYGRRHAAAEADRQMLHAMELTLQHPVTGKTLTFAAPLPPDMTSLRQRLRDGGTP